MSCYHLLVLTEPKSYDGLSPDSPEILRILHHRNHDFNLRPFFCLLANKLERLSPTYKRMFIIGEMSCICPAGDQTRPYSQSSERNGVTGMPKLLKRLASE